MSAIPTTESREHPCFDPSHAKTAARIHLPVAPRCNMQCRFCDRSFDCVNESRPGVTAQVISPREGLERVILLREKLPSLSVIGIAGPGDPLANPDETFETFRLIKEAFPDLSLCMATNGLCLPEHVATIKELGISHLTVTVNAIDPAVGKHVYSWIRYGKRALTGENAAAILWEKQREGIIAARALDITLKVNTILIPSINDGEVAHIAREVSLLGANFMNMIPMIPVKGTPLSLVGEPPAEMVKELRAQAASFLPQLAHCKRCRADAAGLLGEDLDLSKLRSNTASAGGDAAAGDIAAMTGTLSGCGACKARAFVGKGGSDCSSCNETPHGNERAGSTTQEGTANSGSSASTDHSFTLVAVASREGLLVNQHLGEARCLKIYRVAGDGSWTLDSTRTLPGRGDEERWENVASLIGDCTTLLVAGIGGPPKATIEGAGIRVYELEGLIADALRLIGTGHPLETMRVWRKGCGDGCSGSMAGAC